MRAASRLIVVHAYPIEADGQPSQRFARVCQFVLERHREYDFVLLMGGQDRPGQGAETVDQIMKRYLIARGMSESQCVAWSDHCPGYRPPRTHVEEIDLLPTLLRELGFDPSKKTFDAVCIEYCAPRVWYVYGQRGAKLHRLHRVRSFDDLTLLAKELPVFLLTCVDPGQRRWPFTKLHAERDLFPTRPDGTRWLENLPEAWQHA